MKGVTEASGSEGVNYGQTVTRIKFGLFLIAIFRHMMRLI